MAAAYDKWWDDVYPVMIERGGDLEMKWDKKLFEKKPPAKPQQTQESKGKKNLNS
jgi:hypothetical protein